MLDFIYHISPSLIIVFGGSYYFNKFFIRKNNIAGILDSLKNETKEVLNLSINYWSQEKVNTDSSLNQLRSKELEIKQKLQSINVDLISLEIKYKLKLKNSKDLLTELVDGCTGGTFEQATRDIDLTRCDMIIKRSFRFTSSLATHKI